MFKRKLSLILILSMILSGLFSFTVRAEVFYLNGGRQFDSIFYAAYYPELKRAYGTNTKQLLNHYLSYGQYEGRIPSALYLKNMDALTISYPVPWYMLYKRAYLRGNLSQEQFINAYNTGVAIINGYQLFNYKKVEQINFITNAINQRINSKVPYSITAPYYNSMYGVLGPDEVLSANTQGACQAVGLLLNMMAIPYEQVNDKKLKHQWCRVNINGKYYICDPYFTGAFEEKFPYSHPGVPY